jgi:DedD protein
MAAKQNNSEPAGDLSDIKRKLIWRMGIAGLMIIALLGGLALFDHFTSRNEEEVPAPQFTEPVPVAKKTVTQPVTPVEAAPVAEEGTPEASAAPVDKSAPALDLPARPEVSAQPKLPKPSSPTGPAPVMAGRTSETRAAPASAGAVRSEAPPPVAVLPASPAPSRLLSGFALQAGVFSDPRRAEELHAKLTLEGIPSSIESRVQVGPFKRKEDAEAARAKMKALGIDAVLLPPVKTAKPR